MKELIPIYDRDGQQAVSARELHEFLESKREFATWIKDRIKKYGLVENQDYASFDEIVKRDIGSSVRTEYALTIDAAKEISLKFIVNLKNTRIFAVLIMFARRTTRQRVSGYFYTLIKILNGFVPPCGVLMHPQPGKVISSGKGRTVFSFICLI